MSAVNSVTSTPPAYATVNTSSVNQDITLPQISATSSLAQNTSNNNTISDTTSSQIDPNPTSDANAAPAQPVTYTALANANNSTIRGTNLNIQA